jgi:hypothetical protein
VNVPCQLPFPSATILIVASVRLLPVKPVSFLLVRLSISLYVMMPFHPLGTQPQLNGSGHSSSVFIAVTQAATLALKLSAVIGGGEGESEV